MISIGNSVPSLRGATSSIPVPIWVARASAAERRPSAMSRSAKPCRPFPDFRPWRGANPAGRSHLQETTRPIEAHRYH
jgi:hypothetical protein